MPDRLVAVAQHDRLLFNNLEASDIESPWASIAGFADVLALMAVAIWLARRHIPKRREYQPIPRHELEPAPT